MTQYNIVALYLVLFRHRVLSLPFWGMRCVLSSQLSLVEAAIVIAGRDLVTADNTQQGEPCKQLTFRSKAKEMICHFHLLQFENTMKYDAIIYNDTISKLLSQNNSYSHALSCHFLQIFETLRHILALCRQCRNIYRI